MIINEILFEDPRIGDRFQLELGDLLIETVIEDITDDGVVIKLDETGIKLVLESYKQKMLVESKRQRVMEMDKSAPQPGRAGKVSHSTYGTRDEKGSDYFKGKEAPGKAITAKQAKKDALEILKKQGVAEGALGSNKLKFTDEEKNLILELLENNRNMDDYNSMDIYDSAIDKLTVGITAPLTDEEKNLILELLENNRNMDDDNSMDIYDSAIDKLTTTWQGVNEISIHPGAGFAGIANYINKGDDYYDDEDTPFWAPRTINPTTKLGRRNFLKLAAATTAGGYLGKGLADVGAEKDAYLEKLKQQGKVTIGGEELQILTKDDVLQRGSPWTATRQTVSDSTGKNYSLYVRGGWKGGKRSFAVVPVNDEGNMRESVTKSNFGTLFSNEYSRVIRALSLYYPRLSMDELNVPGYHKVIANKADVPVEYAAQVIGDFVKASTRDSDDDTREYDEIDEAKYQGREVPLGKPMKGDVKKSKVYVRGPKGKVVKVNFGDKKMRIKKSNPSRRKSFRARHNCDNPGPRWKARYWSCRAW